MNGSSESSSKASSSDKGSSSSVRNGSIAFKLDSSSPPPGEGKCDNNMQNVVEEEELNYSNVAAKTVANIRRLQENVMSVSVTTSPPACTTSPTDPVTNELVSHGKQNISGQKQLNNVSTISINKSKSSDLTIAAQDQTSPGTMKEFHNLDGITSPTNDASATITSSVSNATNLNTSTPSQNTNIPSQVSTANVQLQQDLIQNPLNSNSRSPDQPSPAKAAQIFFSAVTNQEETFAENTVPTDPLVSPCPVVSSSNNELVTSPRDASLSHTPNILSSRFTNSNSSNINYSIGSCVNTASAYESQPSPSSSGSNASIVNGKEENKPTTSSSSIQRNLSLTPSYPPKSPSSVGTNLFQSNSSSSASNTRTTLPVISNELTSSFNALVTIDPNWQSTKNSIRERNAVMCNNAVMADVWFNVGSETLLQQIQQQQQFEFRNKQGSAASSNEALASKAQNSVQSNKKNSNENQTTITKQASCNSSSIVSSTSLSAALPRKIPGHKYVLATGSTVFYAMFYGGLAMDIDNGSSPDNAIDVPDVEPSAFLTMLKYLYCDTIDLTTDNVLPTLYSAKKYIIPYLAQECVRFLESSLSARNACLLLSQARFFDEPALTQRAWEVIDAQAQLALTSDAFVDIDKDTLKLILARETLNCRETVIFNAAKRWAQAECVRKDIQKESDKEHDNECRNQSEDDILTEEERYREALGDALYLVRFPCMIVQEFADTVAKSGLLTLQETTDIFLYFTASSSQKPLTMQPFITSPRSGLARQICARFGSSQYRTNQWRYRGRTDSIQFCVDRRIFIVGYGLYGSSNGSSEYRAHIELKSSPSFTAFGRGSRVLAENTVKFFSDGSSNSFQVFFKQPVQIEPDVYYTASAVLDGAELSYFGQEGRSEVMVGRVTFQFQYSSESTNGTGVQGGQIPEVIFYGPTPGTNSTPIPSPVQPRHAVQSGMINNGSEASNPSNSSNQGSNVSVSNISRNNVSGNNNNSSLTSPPPCKHTSKDITKPKD